MSGKDVAITGLGLVSPLGKNVRDNWNNVKDMKSGIVRCPGNGLPDFLLHMGKVPEYDLPENIPPKQMGQIKFLNRGALLGLSATNEAISGAMERISGTAPGRRALYVASGDFNNIGYEFMYPAIRDGSNGRCEHIDQEKLNNAALNKVNPFFLLESLHNNLFSFLSAFVEFMGPNTSLASLSPCGGNALELAYRSIMQNNSDVALAVGYGSWINELSIYELEGLGILSGCRAGIHSFRPFDKSRDGFIPGEGGAAVLLESMDTAKQRGAGILGKIRAVENRAEFSSNNTLNVPEKVIKRNLQSVMKSAGCIKEDIALLIPHGSATKKGDRSELRSLLDILGRESKTPVCGLKPYTGHMGAASDIAEVIIGINAVRERTVPATLNFRESDKEFSGLSISGSPQKCENSMFISASYGVGGQSSSVIVDVT
jgi:3-oxoacyl-[acyl-carrier-protein] synthase II